MATNVPNLGQRGVSRAGGKGGLVPQGQGVTQRTKGGPPADTSRHSVSGNGSTTVNSQPARGK